MYDLQKIGSTKEVDLGPLVLNYGLLRVNHLLIKERGDAFNGMSYDLNLDINKLLDPIEEIMEPSDWRERYAYLTIDCGFVEPGKTLRNPGWHVDGFQGDEVEIKKPVDVNYFWCNTLPMEVAERCTNFSLKGFNPSVHNLFNWVGREVEAGKASVSQLKAKHLYKFDGYLIHRGTPARKREFRQILRLSFTHIPITSTKMTINPFIKYDYNYHTTTGDVPSHLI